MEDDRPTASRLADAEENDEDGVPDWSQFAKLVRSSQKSSGDVFIPKRGEKDFEPIARPSTSTSLTLADYQRNQLIQSRNALFGAISSGERHHGSRAYNSFTWDPALDGGRASCDGTSYGVHFGNMGLHNLERKRLELLPEEALYLVERGAIELWREHGPVACPDGGETVEAEPIRVPMTVQQAWAELIGANELTIDRFQVYAYLRRLGYIVTRARARPQAPVRPHKAIARSWLELFQAPFLALQRWVARVLASARQLRLGTAARAVQLSVTRTLQSYEGQFASLLAGRRWATYAHMFARLQIIPAGHDTPLGRGPAPRVPSVLVPLRPHEPHPALPPLELHPYQPFYHVYKPSTKFKKSAPPPPDYRLVVVNANTTSMPDIFEFESMFAAVPLPDPLAAPAPSAVKATPSSPAPSQAPKSRAARAPPRPRAPPPAPKPSHFRKLVSRIPYAEKLLPAPAPARKAQTGPNKAVLYPRLKSGRRHILVAVVDNGTSSFIRFNESEFAKVPWQAAPRAA